jgi:thiamine-phosphate pyrophosphorylase
MEEVYQIIDVNLNRVREGLRVIEEVARFVIKDEKLTKEIKAQRHKLSELFKDINLLKFRDIYKDLGRYGDFDTPSYRELKEQVERNFKRAQEGCRVIEEFSKLFNPKISPMVKQIRFNIYEIEKKFAQLI